jgi:hypothetical protein
MTGLEIVTNQLNRSMKGKKMTVLVSIVQILENARRRILLARCLMNSVQAQGGRHQREFGVSIR